MISEQAISQVLLRDYGPHFPSGLVGLIRFAVSRAESRSGASDDYLFPAFYWRGYALNFFGIESHGSGRSYITPAEFFPFAGAGQDDISYGYLVHAPELSQKDYQIGIFDPAFREGVKLLGNSFENALENLLSGALVSIQEENASDDLQTVAAIAKLFDIQPGIDKSNPNPLDYVEPIVPTIPQGWHFEPSDDGVGVLAPCEAFINIPQEKNYTIFQDIEAALQLVKESLRRNAPGTALFILRELIWRTWNKDIFLQSKELWKEAYYQLQRPILSDVVEEKARSIQLQEEQLQRYFAMEQTQFEFDRQARDDLDEWDDLEVVD